MTVPGPSPSCTQSPLFTVHQSLSHRSLLIVSFTLFRTSATVHLSLSLCSLFICHFYLCILFICHGHTVHCLSVIVTFFTGHLSVSQMFIVLLSLLPLFTVRLSLSPLFTIHLSQSPLFTVHLSLSPLFHVHPSLSHSSRFVCYCHIFHC